MAISLGFGIIFASALVLISATCFYMVLHDLQSRWGLEVAKINE